MAVQIRSASPLHHPLPWCSGWLAASLLACAAHADQTFTVGNSGTSSYLINAQPDPPLTLNRGETYTFNITTPGHPFLIKTIQGSGPGDVFTSGVTGNGTTNGTLVFVVPSNAPDQLFYNCEIHPLMTGPISIVNPPPLFANGFE